MSKLEIPSYEEIFTPFMAYSKMAAESAEKVMKIQMDAVKAFSKLGVENFSEGLKVADFDQMTSYAEKQKDVAKKASEMFRKDAKACADIGAKFYDGAKVLFEENVKSTVDAATKAAKTATGK